MKIKYSQRRKKKRIKGERACALDVLVLCQNWYDAPSLQFFFFVVGRMMKKRSIVQFFIFIYEEYIVHGSHVRVVCVCK